MNLTVHSMVHVKLILNVQRRTSLLNIVFKLFKNSLEEIGAVRSYSEDCFSNVLIITLV